MLGAGLSEHHDVTMKGLLLEVLHQQQQRLSVQGGNPEMQANINHKDCSTHNHRCIYSRVQKRIQFREERTVRRES